MHSRKFVFEHFVESQLEKCKSTSTIPICHCTRYNRSEMSLHVHPFIQAGLSRQIIEHNPRLSEHFFHTREVSMDEDRVDMFPEGERWLMWRN